MSNRAAARFQEIDLNNPQIWHLFEQFTFELIRRGFTHYSADAVLHRIRWQTATPLDDGSEFRVNNNWSAFYARKFRTAYPQHADFFRVRASVADEAA